METVVWIRKQTFPYCPFNSCLFGFELVLYHPVKIIQKFFTFIWKQQQYELMMTNRMEGCLLYKLCEQ